ncbi:helix-turn-helix domain-containing protein [Brachybacterium paraconglomeratum]|uniref:helix-turn-helix domain-containing protein n=1 Tax=Brachybacterium paraconglomeratum TaxID=173362 RepID=UPI003FD4865D
MDFDDAEIGARLQSLRESVVSQATLANAMKDHGHEKWSQATVWAVEAGKRPLRLSEAASLAAILGAEVSDFLQSSAVGKVIGSMREAITDVDRAATDLTAAAVRFEDARTRLRLTVRSIDAEQVSSWPDSERVRLIDLMREADKRMKWDLSDVADLDDRTDLFMEDLIHSEGADDGVDPEAS